MWVQASRLFPDRLMLPFGSILISFQYGFPEDCASGAVRGHSLKFAVFRPQHFETAEWNYRPSSGLTCGINGRHYYIFNIEFADWARVVHYWLSCLSTVTCNLNLRTKIFVVCLVFTGWREMFPRFPPLHHTVFIAACWVGMSVLVILWHFELTGNEVLGKSPQWLLRWISYMSPSVCLVYDW